jgi:hypothetical protein
MKLLTYILLCTLSVNCTGQKQTIKNNKTMQDYNIPIITNQFETFDFETFNKKTSKHRYNEKKGDTFRILVGANSGYGETTHNEKSYFKILKGFYTNGNIRAKGISFNNGSEYGTWYEFSEDGKLVKETNYNQPLNKIGWRYILNYCKRNNIPLTKGYTENGYHTEIYFDKDVEKEDGIWTITWQTAGDKLEEIKLHGASGWQISKKELEFINH